MIIEARGLRKTYRPRGRGGRAGEPVEAVRGIDLEVAEGEIFGVLGPNGAGKTTTIRMLATLVAPTGGAATVAGHDLLASPEQVRRRIGYVGQAGGVDENNTARANLLLAARVNGLTAAEAAARTGEVLAAFDLAGLADRPARTLSGGQKRRVAIALGLVHRPPLLFLDEPTTGLDPQNRANLWDQIRALRDGGTSVLLSTHYLDEADALCDRLVIVDHGLVVAAGTPAELKREIAGDVVSLRLSGTGEAAGVLDGLPYAREVRTDGDLLRVYLDDGERALPHLLSTLTEHGLALESVALDRATLDDVFLRKTGRSLRDAA
ncbi:ATP-binding cassette domain-containing protein [Microbispora sitophila]|uniref:ATP-binding cassette domain-containing protein n=1 Tax=Microbispora sitophila TaxID=2771537 RepID=UPI001D025EEC|nr:ATP-binding cassette domain-containing protein [Microbispora sitophila]